MARIWALISEKNRGFWLWRPDLLGPARRDELAESFIRSDEGLASVQREHNSVRSNNLSMRAPVAASTCKSLFQRSVWCEQAVRLTASLEDYYSVFAAPLSAKRATV